MALSNKQREDLKARVEASALRPEAKEAVLAILSREVVNAEDAGKVLKTISDDIEQDFATVPGLKEDLEKDEEFIAFAEKQEKELLEIEKNVRESVEYLEAQA